MHHALDRINLNNLQERLPETNKRVLKYRNNPLSNIMQMIDMVDSTYGYIANPYLLGKRK